MQKRALFVFLAFAVVLASSGAATDAPAPSTSAAAPDARTCSLEAAVRSVGRVFRGLKTGNAQEVLRGFVERKPIERYAWGFSLERPEEGPHGLDEDAQSSRLIGATVPGIERLVRIRRRQNESLVLVALVFEFTQTRPQVPITVLFVRKAKDVIGYGWGDGGIAKGIFDCDAGRLVWFRGGHTPNQVPVAASASGRIVCTRGTLRQRLFVAGVGWGCAH
ncbi:MAG: hypothetical protein WKF65_15105 [Gaiellaceae bacterium]